MSDAESKEEESFIDLSNYPQENKKSVHAPQLTLFSHSKFNAHDYIDKDNMLSNKTCNVNDRNYPIFEPELKVTVLPLPNMAQVAAPLK